MDGARSLMPAVFVGHGNPMNALQDNAYTRGWRAMGEALPRPNAILAVSAHWYLPGARVTAMPAPRTIHDFGGFPRELSELTYPAPGDPALARRLHDLLAPLPAASVSMRAEESTKSSLIASDALDRSRVRSRDGDASLAVFRRSGGRPRRLMSKVQKNDAMTAHGTILV